MREWIHRATASLFMIAVLIPCRSGRAEEPAHPGFPEPGLDTSAPRKLVSETLWDGGASTFADHLRTELESSAAPVKSIAEIELASFETADTAEPLQTAAGVLPGQPPRKANRRELSTTASSDTASSDIAAGGIATGESIPDWEGRQRPQALDLGDLVGRLMIATGIVLAVAVICVLILRKWMGPVANLKTAPAQRLRHVETLALPQRASLQLVELDGRPILIGMNAAGLQTITPVERSFSESLNAIGEDGVEEGLEASMDETGEMTAVDSDSSREPARPETASVSWTEKAAAFLNSRLTPVRNS